MSFNEKASKIEAAMKAGKKINDSDLLSLYGAYKQAKVGDNKTPAPGVFNMKDSAKWKAWTVMKGKSKGDAERAYVNLATKLGY